MTDRVNTAEYVMLFGGLLLIVNSLSTNWFSLPELSWVLWGHAVTWWHIGLLGMAIGLFSMHHNGRFKK